MDNIDKETITPTGTLNLFYRFFCWCSGARLYILKNCPSEFNKYFGIGIIVFLSGIMASISGGYAIYTVFESTLASIILGLLWGIIIFFIDWYIVSSLRKEEKPLKEIYSALPRLILAVLLAVVISKPIELRLFQKEINMEIETIKKDKSLNYINQVFEEFDEILQLEQKNEQLKNEIVIKETQRDKLFEMIIEEAEGRSPTQLVGKGPVYKEKKQEYDKIDQELKTLRTHNIAQIEANNEIINQMKNQRRQEVSNGKTVSDTYNGMLARLEALGYLSKRNSTVYLVNIFILLLFICIEAAPILVKLMSKRGPYDDLFQMEEYSKSVHAKKTLSDLKISIQQQIDVFEETNKLKKHSLLETNKSMIEDISSAQSEINKMKIAKWKEKELTKTKDNNDELQNEIEKYLGSKIITFNKDNYNN